MPMVRKNGELPEQVRKSKKGPAKLEPLHPKPNQTDKYHNNLAKFPDENPYPVMRIHKNGTLLYANKASKPLLKTRGGGSGRPVSAEWHRIVKKALSSDQILTEETQHDGRIFDFKIVPISGSDYVNFYGVDITERKRLEETLEKERQELNLIIDSSPIIVFHKDKEGKFVRVNRAFAEAIGIPEEKFMGKTVFDLYSAPIAQSMTNDDREVFRTGRPKLNIVEQYESAKGPRWVQTDKIPIFDKDGEIAGMVGFAQDITERLQAEQSVKQSEKRFRELFNNMSSGVAVYEAVDNGQDFVFKDFNKAGQKIDKIRKKDVLGKRVTDVFPGIKEMGLREVLQRVWLSGKAEHHPFTVYKDGRITGWRENYVYKLPGGEIVAVYDNVTEQIQASENLQKERNLLRTLIDNIPDPVYLKDTNSNFIACNKALLKFWGLKNDKEVIGKSNFDFFEKQRAQNYFDEEQKVIQTSLPVINREGQYPDKAGNLHSFLVTKLPLQDSSGNVTGTIGINRDITERKIAEIQLLEYSKQLKKLTAQLALTEERERRRIARDLHDQVSQSLALAKIKLDTLLASQKASPLAQTLKETNDTIEKAILNTRSLTFDLSYPILYEIGFEAAVAEWLQEQVQKKHGIITEFLDDGCAKPLDDDVRVLLFRNVRELLINIIKHANAEKIKVSIAKTDDSIKIKIEDNGVGLNINEITALRKGGFGLLSIRESIGELGGSFKIDSKPGAGCKVTMTAPLKGKRQTKE